MSRETGFFDILQRPGDVDKTVPTHGDGLFWDDTAKLWVPSQIGASGYLYLGDSDTNGSWRFAVIGNNLSVQRRESGSWVEKGLFLA